MSFTVNKYILFLYIFSFPFQVFGDTEGTPDSLQIKIYNVIFLLLLILSIRLKPNPHQVNQIKETPAFSSLGSIPLIILAYFLLTLFSAIWAQDSTSALLFFAKFAFIGAQSYFIFRIIKTDPKSFNIIRYAFEASGLVFCIALIIQILRLGLFTYLIAATDDSEYSIKHQYFINIGLTFGGGKNLLGTWQGIASLIAYSHLYLEKPFMKKWVRIFLYAAFIFSFVGMLLTLSRTAILGWIVGLFAFHFFSKTFSVFLRRIALLFPFIILLMLATDTLMPLFNLTVEHFGNIGRVDDAGSSGRRILWSIAKDLLNDHFFLGIGIGNSKIAIHNTPAPPRTIEDNFHNLFLNNFVELGLFGGLLFLSIWFGILWKGIKKVLGNQLIDIVVRNNLVVTLSILLAYTFFCLFQFKGAEPEIWLFLIIVYSLSTFPGTSNTPSKDLLRNK